MRPIDVSGSWWKWILFGQSSKRQLDNLQWTVVGVLTSVDCFAFGVEALLTSMEFFLLLTFLVLSITVVIAMISFDFKWFDKGVFDWLTSMELLLRETNFSRFKWWVEMCLFKSESLANDLVQPWLQAWTLCSSIFSGVFISSCFC